MYKNKSIFQNKWLIKEFDERKILYLSQKFNISFFLSKLLCSTNLEEKEISDLLNQTDEFNIPDPFILKDMEKTVLRTIDAIEKNEKIGIIADYDVDGSTSAAILYNFLKKFNKEILIKVPERLTEGYGPNNRIMNEFIEEKVSLIFCLDCGTSSFSIFDDIKYAEMDIIVIDHHISERKFPKIFSIINPNRFDEGHEFINLAAVGVTFLFLMALRKKLRNSNFFKKIKEPNLLNYLDLVALGTVCDVVFLDKLNKLFVNKGLNIIKQRKSIPLTKIIDNLNIRAEPTSELLGYSIGPQINAASRLGNSSLPSKILVSHDINEIDTISRKLFLYNEKRKLIENAIYDDALKQVKNTSKFILIYGENWHNGVLGIVASRLLKEFYKPVIVISFNNNIGIGSARSIDSINLGNIIIQAKNEDLLLNGGGHSAAAGLKINKKNIENFSKFLHKSLEKFDKKYFVKKSIYIDKLSIDQIKPSLLDDLKKIEPFGKGNEEPNFIFTNIKIQSIKKIKNKHFIVFFKNSLNETIKGYCFNSVNTVIGDYLEKHFQFTFDLAGTLKEDNFSKDYNIQIIIKDLMLLN